MKVEEITLFKKKHPIIISGPCSAENENQLLETCQALAKLGKVDIIRAGIWKPRTRPNSFEGIGAEALKWLVKARDITGIPVAVEVANAQHVKDCLAHKIDYLWIGARTTVNPFSVQEIADALKGANATVFVKNPINADVELWTGALERLYQSGTTKLGMIHRGFAKYGKSIYRNEPQWQLAVEMKRRFPDIPMICDPSHICGNRELLSSVAQKALDLNFDGIMLESHIDPDNALSDKAQQVTPDKLGELLSHLIVRKPNVLDVASNERLEVLREQIDTVDNEILNLLGQRMKYSEDIGVVKKEKGITILQNSRWEEIIETAKLQGTSCGLSEKFMLKYLNAIHQESIDHQNEIMNEDIA